MTVQFSPLANDVVLRAMSAVAFGKEPPEPLDERKALFELCAARCVDLPNTGAIGDVALTRDGDDIVLYRWSEPEWPGGPTEIDAAALVEHWSRIGTFHYRQGVFAVEPVMYVMDDGFREFVEGENAK